MADSTTVEGGTAAADEPCVPDLLLGLPGPAAQRVCEQLVDAGSRRLPELMWLCKSSRQAVAQHVQRAVCLITWPRMPPTALCSCVMGDLFGRSADLQLAIQRENEYVSPGAHSDGVEEVLTHILAQHPNGAPSVTTLELDLPSDSYGAQPPASSPLLGRAFPGLRSLTMAQRYPTPFNPYDTTLHLPLLRGLAHCPSLTKLELHCVKLSEEAKQQVHMLPAWLPQVRELRTDETQGPEIIHALAGQLTHLTLGGWCGSQGAAAVAACLSLESVWWRHMRLHALLHLPHLKRVVGHQSWLAPEDSVEAPVCKDAHAEAAAQHSCSWEVLDAGTVQFRELPLLPVAGLGQLRIQQLQLLRGVYKEPLTAQEAEAAAEVLLQVASRGALVLPDGCLTLSAGDQTLAQLTTATAALSMLAPHVAQADVQVMLLEPVTGAAVTALCSSLEGLQLRSLRLIFASLAADFWPALAALPNPPRCLLLDGRRREWEMDAESMAEWLAAHPAPLQLELYCPPLAAEQVVEVAQALLAQSGRSSLVTVVVSKMYEGES